MQKEKNENLLEMSPENFSKDANSRKPEGLPERFWDEAGHRVKLDELIADYNSLVQRDDNLVEANLRNLPADYRQYRINIQSPLLEPDEEIFKRFYEKGFSNEQAQLVYDLAAERVLPVLDEMSVNFEAERQLEKLAAHFGGRDKFNEISRQISAWAKTNVKAEVYEALGATAEGVVALYNMMSSSEPMLGREGGQIGELSEQSLRKMMEDPRYWRDKDRDYVAKITKGFEKLYPEK